MAWWLSDALPARDVDIPSSGLRFASDPTTSEAGALAEQLVGMLDVTMADNAKFTVYQYGGASADASELLATVGPVTGTAPTRLVWQAPIPPWTSIEVEVTRIVGGASGRAAFRVVQAARGE